MVTLMYRHKLQFNSLIFRQIVYVCVALLAVSCGGGGGGGGSTTPTTGGTGGTTSGVYSVGGAIVGLDNGVKVTLQNNGGDTISVGNGSFTFPSLLDAGATYDITIAAQPANGQSCVFTTRDGNSYGTSSGAGTVYAMSVDTVRLNCASVFTIAGSGATGYGDAPGEEATFWAPSGIASDSIGNLYVTDFYNNVVRKISTKGVVTSLAGAGTSGYVDATGTAAKFSFDDNFNGRSGLALDSLGNVYVADSGNNVIRKITPAGVVTTFAGSGVAGYLDGTGTSAQFNSPQGIAVDNSGNLFVADTANHRIRKITSAGIVTTLAGSGSTGKIDGTGTAATFYMPRDVAIDGAGNLYVADTFNYAVRKVTTSGVVTTLAGGAWGFADLTGTAAKFTEPSGVAVDAGGNVYVADSNYFQVRMIAPDGKVSLLAGYRDKIGFKDGHAVSASFYPGFKGVAVDGNGNVYVPDFGNRRVRKISRKAYNYTIGGQVVGLASGKSLVLRNNAGDDLTVSANGYFSFATALSETNSYNVTILTQPSGQSCTLANGSGSFTVGNVLTVGINCAAVSTLAGSGTAGFTDATSTAAQFSVASTANSFSGIALDASGTTYIADTYNHAIRKITAAGVVTTLAGSGTAGYVDATGTAAKFSYPSGIAVDGAGNVYVGDTGNDVIRRISPAGVVTTLAGSGVWGFADGTGTAAKFASPVGVALDGAGNLYVADASNFAIRKVTSAGVVSTILSGSGYVNGSVAIARIGTPYGIAVDGNGNIYVGDTNNYAVRKITPLGIVTSLAGSIEGYQNTGYINSTGTGAQFGFVSGLAVDSSGVLYVADQKNNVIRRINQNGTVTTLAGSQPGVAGYVNGNGTTAQFNLPSGVAVDATGNIYVVDNENNAIRRIAQ